MLDFDNKFFTKKCENCAYYEIKQGFFSKKEICNNYKNYNIGIAQYSCRNHINSNPLLGWKPSEKVIKELYNLKQEFPQFFI